MAEGKPIQKSDLIEPGIIDQLKAELKSVQKDLSDASTKRRANVKETNKGLSYTVEITEDLLRLKKNEARLDKEINQLKKEQSKLGANEVKEKARLASAIEVLKQQRAKNNLEAKNEAKISQSLNGSMNELSLSLAKNKKAYRDLTEQERKNNAIGGKLLKTINKQDVAIKKLDKSIGENYRNVGNYGSALEGVAGQFGIMGSILPKVKAGLSLVKAGFTTLKGAIMSTGIGALVIALGSLITYLTDTASGTSKLAKVMAPLKAIMSTLTSLAKQFGEALSLFADGKWDEGFKLMKGAVSGVSDEYRKQIDLQEQLAELERIHHERLKASILTLAQLRTQMSENEKISKDRTVTEKERLDAMLRAIELTNKIAKEEQALAALQVSIQATKSQMSADSREEEIELERLREAFEQKDQARFSRQKTQLRFLDTLRREYIATLTAEQIATLNLADSIDTKLIPVENEQIEKIQERTIYSKVQVGEQIKGLTEAEQAALSSTNALKAIGEDNQAVAAAEATVNSYLAGTQVLRDPTLPSVIKIPSMIAIIAAGLKSVASILGVGFAEGTENVEGGIKGKDSVRAMLMPGERVMTVQQNKALHGISNDEIPGMVALGKQANNLTPDMLRLAGNQLHETAKTNKMLGKLCWVDPKGIVYDLRGNKRQYVD